MSHHMNPRDLIQSDFTQKLGMDTATVEVLADEGITNLHELAALTRDRAAAIARRDNMDSEQLAGWIEQATQLVAEQDAGV